MPTIYSTDEVIKNFDKSTDDASFGHLKRAMIWMVIAIILFFSGLATIYYYSSPVLTALLLFAAVFSNQKSNSHHVMAEMSNLHRVMAQVIVSVAQKTNADSVLSDEV